MPLGIINGPFIQPGQSLSDAIDVTGGTIVRITMPGAWSNRAPLTLVISTDGILYNDLCDQDGIEIVLAVTPGATVIVPESIGRALAFVKFRSGSAHNEMPQDELREFAVAVLT